MMAPFAHLEELGTQVPAVKLYLQNGPCIYMDMGGSKGTVVSLTAAVEAVKGKLAEFEEQLQRETQLHAQLAGVSWQELLTGSTWLPACGAYDDLGNQVPAVKAWLQDGQGSAEAAVQAVRERLAAKAAAQEAAWARCFPAHEGPAWLTAILDTWHNNGGVR
jgi:hypothetical protein